MANMHPRHGEVLPSGVAATEVLGWIREHRPRVREEQLTDFVALLNLHILAKQQPRKSTLPSPRAVIGDAHTLRSNLDQIEEALGGEFWNLLGAPRGAMEGLRAALAALGGFLRPAPPPKTRGRNRAAWHESATWYAAAIAAALRNAGYRDPSLVNGAGPVAHIGIAAVARVWGITVDPATFANVVRAQRDDAARRVADLRRTVMAQKPTRK